MVANEPLLSPNQFAAKKGNRVVLLLKNGANPHAGTISGFAKSGIARTGYSNNAFFSCSNVVSDYATS